MTKRKLEKNVMKHGGNIPLVASIIVLIAFVAGLLVGTLVVAKTSGGNKLSGLVSPMTGAFADGWNAAKKKLAEFNPQMGNVSSLSGQITAVKGKEISFKTALINPLDDESLKTRIAVIDNNTKITVWKLKTSEQAAKDQKESQATTASLQKESEALRATINDCNQKMMKTAAPTAAPTAAITEESADCKTARAKSDANMKAMVDAQQKMDVYQKVDNASLSDVKVGWNISVMSLALKTGDATKAPTPMMSQYENIASSQKFTASSIDVREMSNPSAAMPGGATPGTGKVAP